MNSRENEIWLGGDVDQSFLFLSTKRIWVWVGRMRDPLSLRCSLMEERESGHDIMICKWSTYPFREKGVYL
jgi:hypothetical protein